MKNLLFLLCCLLTFSSLFAQSASQQNKDTIVRVIDLNEVFIKPTDPEKVSNNVRPQNVFIVLPKTTGVRDAQFENTYFATKFFLSEDGSIFLHSVELRLKPFDSSMFAMNLILFQISGTDTSFFSIPIKASDISKKERIKVALYDKDINLKHGEFYIGFGFQLKNIQETFKYRMYSTNNGEGAILTLKDGMYSVSSNPHFPYVFPFKLAYRKI